MRLIPMEALFLSDVVFAEIRYGIENMASRMRRESLLAWIRDRVRPSFAGRILPINEDILLRWRWIVERGRQRGYTFEQSDALLAATADHHGLIILSRDSRPFAEADVPCVDP
jgi:predicted nucleic acid-binding protein